MRPFYEMQILAKAIAFPNLSLAATQIGLSQSQLSRILSRVESDLGIQLLDRSVKRKVSWLPAAYELVRNFERLETNFEDVLLKIGAKNTVPRLGLACLEGLIPLAQDLAAQLLKSNIAHQVELDVLDTGELESGFATGTYGVIFSSRIPGLRKYPRVLKMGIQPLDSFNLEKQAGLCLSRFEKRIQKKTKVDSSRIVVSNSLAVRRHFIHELDYSGTLPGAIKPFSRKLSKSPGKEAEVLCIVSEDIPNFAWQFIENKLRSLAI